MATIGTVLVLVLGVLDTTVDCALVPMVIVLVMQMPIVHVIQMIVMGNCGVTAIGAMDMWVLVLHNEIMPQAGSLCRKVVS